MIIAINSLIKEKPDINIYLPSYLLSDFKTDSKNIEELLHKRKQARLSKNFIESDRIRDELKSQGITLIDQKNGSSTIQYNKMEDDFGRNISFKLEFSLPHKSGYEISHTIEFSILSESEAIVWFDEYRVDSIFDNFPLATKFTFITKNKKEYLVSDWSEEESAMVIGGKWKNGRNNGEILCY